jgi:hypothetical protein
MEKKEVTKTDEEFNETVKQLGDMLQEDLRKKGNEHLTLNIGGVNISKENLPMTKEEIDKIRIKMGECYEDIIFFLKDYIDMREENYPLIALWIIGTYFHKSFTTFPYLFVNAMRGSGKTRLLGIIKELSWNGELLTSIREASLFRSAGNNTICIDEFEGIMKKENAGLREILNASYKKGMKIKRMKKVKNLEGEDYQVQEFEPYTPIVMANIWGVEEVLGDRCISIILEKSDKKHLILKMEDFIENDKIMQIKGKLTQCSLCSVVSPQNINKKWNSFIGDIYINTTLTTLTTYNTPFTQEEDDKSGVVNVDTSYKKLDLNSKELNFFNKIHQIGVVSRNLELFMPLFIIANIISPVILNKILRISKQLSDEKKEEERTESRDVMVFQFIAMQDDLGDFIDLVELLNHFKNYVHDDEKDFQWLNSKWLGRSLKRLGLVIDKRRLASGMQVRLDVKKAIEKVKIFK